MWSKKWYLERNIPCDAHLLNELLETDVPWDDALVVSAGKLRKLRDSLSELRSSLCERWLERTVLRPALLPVKTAQFTQFLRQVWRHSNIAQFNWECIGRYTPLDGTDKYAGHWVQHCIHFVIMICEVRLALRTAISCFTNIISQLLTRTEDAACFITCKGRLLQRLNRCAYEGYLSTEFKAWNVWRKMQSVKDSKTTVLYNKKICCNKMKASSEDTFNSTYCTEVQSTTKGQAHAKYSVSLYCQRAPPYDHCCVVSLQPRHIIRYTYTIVSGQYYYADWRKCNVYR